MELVLTMSHEVNLAAFTANNVKRIFSVSVPIIRDLTKNMMTDSLLLLCEMLVYSNHLTRLSAREECLEVSHETLNSEIMPTNHFHSFQVCML